MVRLLLILAVAVKVGLEIRELSFLVSLDDEKLHDLK